MAGETHTNRPFRLGEEVLCQSYMQGTMGAHCRQGRESRNAEMMLELNIKRVSRRGPRGDVELRAQQRVWSCQILQWQLGRIWKRSQRERQGPGNRETRASPLADEGSDA